MQDNGFSEGKLEYRVKRMTPAELAVAVSGSWRDGFIAFANNEKRLEELQGTALNSDFFTGRVQALGIAGAEGYVSEIDLWRRDGDILEEIAAEREDDTFQVQSWRLDTAPEPGSGNCWHGTASTRTGSHHQEGRRLFRGELPTVEVVWPEYRLNFYITRGE